MQNGIYIYGAGERFSKLCPFIDKSNFCILGVFDGKDELAGQIRCGYTILKKDEACHLNHIKMCITIENRSEYQAVKDYLSSNIDDITFVSFEDLIITILCELPQVQSLLRSTQFISTSSRTSIFDCPNGLVLGGVESWSVELSNELNRNDYQSIVVAPRKQDKFWKNDEIILYKEMEVLSGLSIHPDDVYKYIDYVMQQMPCNIITCSCDTLLLAACVIKKYFPKDIQIISVIHNRNANLMLSHLLYAEYIDRYIGVSEEIVTDMLSFHSKIQIQKMNLPFLCEEKLEHDYSVDDMLPIRICFVGRIVREQKRSDLMILIINELIKRKINFRCQIAGSGDGIREIQNALMDSERWVHIIGELPKTEMNQFFSAQDIYVNCSDYEGNCISKLEAMGCGCVPIVTNTSGIEGIVFDGINGYIVDKEDYLSIVDRIEDLYTNRGLLPLLGQKAHEIVYPISRMKYHLEQWISILCP